ncbi:peptidylprolyl isomerase [Nonlabens antarcticus]|uniref:peptidylprolyl isomerase n=1 Tax=Nonlabens antarcticus TaxID=392714 RepID=UPI00189198DC|nr:peptidylprolyl isomerase [Nonlabens antarcticus]
MIRVSYLIFLVTLCFSNFCKAQQLEDKTLLTVDGIEFDAGTFMRVYLKNLDIVQDDSQKDMDNYLELYVDYRLKLLQAYELGLQNGDAYQKELLSYRNSLAESYLTDNEVTDALVKQAYNRMMEEVNASHIIVNVLRTATPADSLKAYKKIAAIKKQVENGADFATVAREESEGPSAASGGELGWFGVFTMVDEFENAAYGSEVGQISGIFRTDFGYHILKVNSKRQTPDEVTVAHIMTYDQRVDTTNTAQQRINLIYGQLEAGKEFSAMAREFSEDINSSRNDGKLSRFGTGDLNTPEFEQAAFELTEINSYTKPVQSKFGWHIIQLLEKHPTPSFEDSEPGLREQIKNSPRSRKITDAFTNKLIAKYGVQLPEIDSYTKKFPQVTDSLMTGTWTNNVRIKSMQPLFAIKDQSYVTNQFYDFISQKQLKDYGKYGDLEEKLAVYFKDYINASLINYYDENLERDNEDFAFIYKEYKEGLLLFDLMEKKVWEEAKIDSTGQQDYYNSHKDNYRWKRRLDIVLTQNTTSAIAEKVRDLLQEGKTVDQIKEQLNDKGRTQVMVSKGVVEESFPRLPENFEVKKGVSRVYEKENNGFYKVVLVNDILEPSFKNFEEARGNVINDYQQELEKKWLDSLRIDRNINVDENVFTQVKEEIENKRS